MFYVYVIQNQDCGDLYFGYSSNLKKRILDHNSGLSRYTKKSSAWELIYYEAYKNKKDAQKREQQIKHHGRVYSQLKRRILGGGEN